MALKDLSTKQLRKAKEVLALFAFYGINEEDIKHLPQLFNDVKKLGSELASLKEENQTLKKTIIAMNQPDYMAKKEEKALHDMCFNLPEVENYK